MRIWEEYISQYVRRKETKTKKISEKLSRDKKSLNVIMNKILF